jgi:hypothetical protein
MAYHGFCKDRSRHKLRYPKSRKQWKVTCNTPYSNSPYGRVVYTREQDNPRLFTRTPRGASEWKVKFKGRISSERSIKRKKVDYQLENTRMRGCNRWFLGRFSGPCVNMLMLGWLIVR